MKDFSAQMVTEDVTERPLVTIEAAAEDAPVVKFVNMVITPGSARWRK